MKYYAIIVAGGSGSRMKSDIPKQFLLLDGKPVLMHTIEAFDNSDLQPEIIVVLNSIYFEFWEELCRKHKFSIPVKLASNGEQRFHSVKNGLGLVDEDSIVAVHDAVRPVVTNELITRSFQLANEKGAVIPVVMSRDSVRKKNGDTTISLNREDVLLVQTPQVFQSSPLKQAYLQGFNTNFTDDASVAEAFGMKIHTTDGDYKNIKITHPEDLDLAALFLKHKA